MTAWKQTPCGTLPDDDALIAARIGMPLKLFHRHRALLMRGWSRAADGRLFHGTLTERVLDMLSYRRKESERRGRNRGAPEVVPLVSRGTDAGLPQDSRGPPGTSTSTSTSTGQKNSSSPSSTKKRAQAAPMLKPDDVTDATWQDWCAIRKAKKSPPSQTAVAQVRAEAKKAGMGLEQALATSCARGWAGFEAGWLRSDVRGRAPPFQTAKQRDAEDAAEQFREMTNGLINGRGHAMHEIIDMEDGDAPRLQIG